MSPADLLFWADEVRNLGQQTEQVAECADLIARHMEWAAQQLLLADVGR